MAAPARTALSSPVALPLLVCCALALCGRVAPQCPARCLHIYGTAPGLHTLQEMVNRLPGYSIIGENHGFYTELHNLHRRFSLQYKEFWAQYANLSYPELPPSWKPAWYNTITPDGFQRGLRSAYALFFKQEGKPMADVCGVVNARLTLQQHSKPEPIFEVIDFFNGFCDTALVLFHVRDAATACGNSDAACVTAHQRTLDAYKAYAARNPQTTFFSTWPGLLQSGGNMLPELLTFLGLPMQVAADKGLADTLRQVAKEKLAANALS